MSRGAFLWLEEQARRTLAPALYAELRPLVRRAVMRMSVEAPDVPFHELAAWAWQGVLEGLERAPAELDDEDRVAYAVYRAQGALLDAVADRDPDARAARALSARLTKTIRLLERQIGRAPHEDAIASALGMTRRQYADALEELAASGVARLEVTAVAPSIASAFARLKARPTAALDVRAALPTAIRALPERLRALVELHHGEGLPIEAAARRLGLDTRRAVMLHTEAIHRLRARLDDHG